MGPQEYTLIKMRVLELRGPLAALEGGCSLLLCDAFVCRLCAPALCAGVSGPGWGKKSRKKIGKD